MAGSVGCLSASTKAYQVTLKISSTTITLGGRDEHFMFGGHVSVQDGKNDLDPPSVITLIVLLVEIAKDGMTVGWCPGF